MLESPALVINRPWWDHGVRMLGENMDVSEVVRPWEYPILYPGEYRIGVICALGSNFVSGVAEVPGENCSRNGELGIAVAFSGEISSITKSHCSATCSAGRSGVDTVCELRQLTLREAKLRGADCRVSVAESRDCSGQVDILLRSALKSPGR